MYSCVVSHGIESWSSYAFSLLLTAIINTNIVLDDIIIIIIIIVFNSNVSIHISSHRIIIGVIALIKCYCLNDTSCLVLSFVAV
jgi:hypothetical protein